MGSHVHAHNNACIYEHEMNGEVIDDALPFLRPKFVAKPRVLADGSVLIEGINYRRSIQATKSLD